tara:strand:+ start:204 stop:971 length:768 start_codon:yes stop_codon:yes gene_type:complete
MGRFGDTKIREVNGAPAHVNDTEAHWIDNMGPLGQLATESVGAGTINPETGLKEYFWPQALGLAFQVGGPLLDAQLNKDSSNLEENMQPWQDTMNKQSAFARDMMNPESQWSMEGANKIREAGKDNLAFTNMLGGRNKAMGGVQGYSGITEQQNEANLNRVASNSQNRITDFNRNNGIQGNNLLANIGSQQRQYGEMQTNRDVANMPLSYGDMMSGLGAGFGTGFNMANNSSSPEDFKNMFDYDMDYSGESSGNY